MSFPDETKKEVWLALRRDGERGTGKATNPYDASGPTLFSNLMNSFQENTTIHLGPGIFQTFGYNYEDDRRWSPKSGQRIVGAGMYITTLKVVGAQYVNHVTVGVANEPDDSSAPFLDGFQASDFTVDCNMRGHRGKHLCLWAVSVDGSRSRLRRIRAIDFGSEDVRSDPLECFPIATGGAHPSRPESYDCVIENCVVEKPYKNGRYNSICLLVGGGENENHVPAYHRGCVIRNNLVNCEYVDNPVPISRL